MTNIIMKYIKTSFIYILLIAILGYLQYGLWLGKNNYFDYKENKSEFIAMQAEIKALKQRNTQMIAELNSLKTGREAIEERAIQDFGMIYPDEHFFRIIDNRANSHLNNNSKNDSKNKVKRSQP